MPQVPVGCVRGLELVQVCRDHHLLRVGQLSVSLQLLTWPVPGTEASVWRHLFCVRAVLHKEKPSENAVLEVRKFVPLFIEGISFWLFLLPFTFSPSLCIFRLVVLVKINCIDYSQHHLSQKKKNSKDNILAFVYVRFNHCNEGNF